MSPSCSAKILVVDDAPQNLALLTAALEPQGYEVLAASGGKAALKVAERAAPDLILLDILLPDLNGLEVCRRLKQTATTREIPVIFLTARTEVASVVEGFSAGGVDYVVKPFQTEEVISRVATHMRLNRLARELREKNQALEVRTAELTQEIRRRHEAEQARERADEQLAVLSGLEAERWNLAGLIGGSRHIRRVIEEIRRLQAFDRTSVLITGESGTGKELVARAIHFDSRRSQGPFIPVNCVAIPGELAESLLFGHVKGAFTGAVSDRKGYFELADGGTLFLDEIGDMPASLQVKLLRVLEDGCVTPVGSTQSRKVDVRIVAATNADLDARIGAGTFRQDLFFRLARYRVNTPTLRERPEDIPVLALHFLRLFAAEMGLRPPPLTPPAQDALQHYDFPGNVRELKNIIERALIESGGDAIRPEHLGLPVVRERPATATRATRQAAAESLPLNLAAAEDLLIQRALQETGGNIADAARLLGVHRTRIYRKLAQEEIDPAPASKV
ncbi:MAG TPA: sigma-54 dependent transcriptional regulator [Verrucomicrobiota bacterium]|nr:DNA-binding response regulator [Verrucomicrobiales bacterium]HRI15858.1 sigma-54 dependent transcriptional regulator [Verrucomicrobiota bacterium]